MRDAALAKAAGGRGTVDRRPGGWRDPASIAALVLFAVLFFALRTPIVAAAPGLASLYQRLGMPVNLRGLDFRNVGVTRDSVGGASGLVVTGEILNPAGGARGIPDLRFTLYDESGREVGGWSAHLDLPPLSAGEAAPFRSRLADPPDAARQLKLRFEDAAKGTS